MLLPVEYECLCRISITILYENPLNYVLNLLHCWDLITIELIGEYCDNLGCELFRNLSVVPANCLRGFEYCMNYLILVKINYFPPRISDTESSSNGNGSSEGK